MCIRDSYNPWPDTPRIERIFVRDLSDLTYNNAVGVGMADVVTDRLVDRIDWVPTRVNSLTASTPSAIRTPIHYPVSYTHLDVYKRQMVAWPWTPCWQTDQAP